MGTTMDKKCDFRKLVKGDTTFISMIHLILK